MVSIKSKAWSDAGPHGIQPEPNRAKRRMAPGLTVPLTHMGTPPGCRGFGIM
jgi:hypothetical protein